MRPSPRQGPKATQLHTQECRTGGEVTAFKLSKPESISVTNSRSRNSDYYSNRQFYQINLTKFNQIVRMERQILKL